PPITPTTPGVTQTEKLLIDTGSQASAGTQAGSVGQAIRNAYQLVQGPQVSQNGVFFSSRNDPSQVRDVDFWFSVGGNKFTGIAEGNGYDLSMGVQASFTPSLTAGVALSYNNLELISTAGKLEVEGLIAGPYFNYTAGALTFNGYALYGETDYDLNGATAEGDRLIYGLTASMQIDRASMSISPYVSVSGYSESIGALGAAPAKDVDQASLGLGARIDFTSVQNMNPYLVVGVDAWQFDDGLTTTSEITPRIGAGVQMPVGNGSVSIDFSAAEVAKDLTQVNVGIRYNLKF
ncbi:MAG: autotransporter outer membrane beta-barrel domain-containing protein, partial [Sulfitobacter sp.]